MDANYYNVIATRNRNQNPEYRYKPIGDIIMNLRQETYASIISQYSKDDLISVLGKIPGTVITEENILNIISSFKKTYETANSVIFEFILDERYYILKINKTPKHKVELPPNDVFVPILAQHIDTTERLYTIMPKLDGYVTLHTFINNIYRNVSKYESNEAIDSTNRWVVIRNLFRKIYRMHELQICHRDLHARNIMVNTVNYDIIFIDYDSACSKDADCSSNIDKRVHMEVAHSYNLPPVADIPKTYLFWVDRDWYAFGIICLNILDYKQESQTVSQDLSQEPPKKNKFKELIDILDTKTNAEIETFICYTFARNMYFYPNYMTGKSGVVDELTYRPPINDRYHQKFVQFFKVLLRICLFRNMDNKLVRIQGLRAKIDRFFDHNWNTEVVISDPDTQGDPNYIKYLKYKSKYLTLKKLLQ